MCSADREKLERFIAVIDFKRFIAHCRHLGLTCLGVHLVMTEEKSSTFSTLKNLHFKFHTAYTEAAFCPCTQQFPMICTYEISEMRMVFTPTRQKDGYHQKVVKFMSRLLCVRRLSCRSEMFQFNDFNHAQAPLKLLQGNSTTGLGKGLPLALRYHGKCRPTRLELHERVVFTGSNDNIPHGQLVKIERLPGQSSSKIFGMFNK